MCFLTDNPYFNREIWKNGNFIKNIFLNFPISLLKIYFIYLIYLFKTTPSFKFKLASSMSASNSVISDSAVTFSMRA